MLPLHHILIPINFRQLCTMESAALANPDMNVILIMKSDVVDVGGAENEATCQIINKENFYVHWLDPKVWLT